LTLDTTTYPKTLRCELCGQIKSVQARNEWDIWANEHHAEHAAHDEALAYTVMPELTLAPMIELDGGFRVYQEASEEDWSEPPLTATETDEIEDVERALRSVALDLSYHDHEQTEPVWNALAEDDYPAAVSLILGMVEKGAVAVHRRRQVVLKVAAARFNVNADVLDNAWVLPDRWNCSTPDAIVIAREAIERIGARLDDPLRFIRESFYCGEWTMALEDFTAVIQREGLELTVAEQTALRMALWYLSPAWFQDLPVSSARRSI
jgi:hypothetical protein